MPRVDTNGNIDAREHIIITGLALVAAATTGLYLVCAPGAQIDLPKEVPAAAPAPELPCVQEECSERPGWLTCEFPGTGICHKYRVVYERTCVCIKRGAP